MPQTNKLMSKQTDRLERATHTDHKVGVGNYTARVDWIGLF